MVGRVYAAYGFVIDPNRRFFMRFATILTLAALLFGCSQDPGNSDPDPLNNAQDFDAAQTDEDAASNSMTVDGGSDETDVTTTNDGGEVESGWSDRKALPSAQQETSVLAYDSKIWVLGGFNDAGQEVATVRYYDPATDEWTARADFPLPAHHMNAVVHDGKFWVTGFMAGGFGADGRSFVYDPVADSWSPGPDLPTGRERGSSAVGVIDGKIYVAGGADGGNAFAYTDVLDPSTETWTELADMPRDVDHAAFGVIDGKLVVAAGRDGSITAFVDEVDIYDPVADSWSSGAPIPTARGGVASAVLDDVLYVFGGEGNSGAPGQVFGEVEAYDFADDSWTQLEAMPIPRHGLGAASLDGVIYLPGGGDAIFLAATAAHQVFVP